MAQILVSKKDGTIEPLNIDKIEHALRKSGAGRALAREVIEAISPRLHSNMTTDEIYALAFSQLRNFKPGAAARFGLKSALLKFGPDGYPFETFVGALLKGRGYATRLRQIVQGRCVSHEIDVMAQREATKDTPKVNCIIECKFHNASDMRCHIQSALYSWARFLDVRERHPEITSVWLATNTKFSSDTIQYADCVGLKLLGWSFPESESLQVRIEEHKLYPVTVLNALDRKTFSLLHSVDIILVPELLSAPDEYLVSLGLVQKRIDTLKAECRRVMSNKN